MEDECIHCRNFWSEEILDCQQRNKKNIRAIANCDHSNHSGDDSLKGNALKAIDQAVVFDSWLEEHLAIAPMILQL